MSDNESFSERIRQILEMLDATLIDGIQELRKLFLGLLGARRLDDCQQLLDALPTQSNRRLGQEHGYLYAILLFERRDFTAAERVLQGLLAEPDNLPTELHARLFRTRAMLANEQGRIAESIQYVEQSSALFATGDNRLEEAKNYNNLGIFICDQVRYDPSLPEDEHESQLRKAVDSHRQVIDILNQIDEPQTSHQLMRIRSLRGQGVAYGLLQEHGNARTVLEEQIRLCRELGAPARFALASGLTNLVPATNFLQGNYGEAHQALTEAVELFTALNEPFGLREAYHHLGHLYQLQGQLDDALSFFEEAIQATESIRARITAPTSQAGYRSRLESIYKAPLTIHLTRDDAEQAFNAAERARSRVLVDLLASQLPQVHGEIPDELIDRRQDLYSILDRAYSQNASTDEIRDLEADLADVERQIEQEDPAYHQLTAVTAITLPEVIEALPQDAALLTYMSDSDDQFWAMVVTKNTPPLLQRVPNIKVSWLEDYLLEHLDTEDGIHRGKLTPIPTSDSFSLSPVNDLFSNLFKVLVEPLWNQLESAKTVYIIPTGTLHYIPIGTLSKDSAKPPPLMANGRSIVYAPSTTVLLTYCHKQLPSPNQGVLALSPSYTDLKFTAGLAKAITGDNKSECLQDKMASVQALLDNAKQYQIVAFLGHAFFNHQYPMSSYLKLADRNLRASEILQRLRLHTDLVILGACESGRSQVLQGDELLGLSRALLYAGTPSLLVTLWEVHEVPTRLFIEKFFDELDFGSTTSKKSDNLPVELPVAVAKAQRWLQDLSYGDAKVKMNNWGDVSEHEVEEELRMLWGWTHRAIKSEADRRPHMDDKLFAHPHFWSAYVLIGDQAR